MQGSLNSGSSETERERERERPPCGHPACRLADLARDSMDIPCGGRHSGDGAHLGASLELASLWGGAGRGRWVPGSWARLREKSLTGLGRPFGSGEVKPAQQQESVSSLAQVRPRPRPQQSRFTQGHKGSRSSPSRVPSGALRGEGRKAGSVSALPVQCVARLWRRQSVDQGWLFRVALA